MSTVADLPKIFDTFSQQRRQSFITAKEFKQSGTPLVGIFCTYMPIELPLAAGAAVVSLCSVSDETIPAAEQDLPRNLCPLIKASYGFAKTDKCPYFYFSDLVIAETTCDGKKKMYEHLADFKDVWVMELTNNQSEDALRLWKKEILRLKACLEQKFGVEITEEKLRAAVAQRNRERRALVDFYELMKMDPPPMTGMDCYKVLNGSSFRFDREAARQEIVELTQRLRQQGGLKEKRPRILVTGSPLGGVYQKVLSALEENAYAVAFESCSGAKSLYEMVDEDAGDIYDALARRYLHIGCSCMSPNTYRMDLLRRMIDEFRIDGVVEVVLQTCLTYAIETRNVRRLVTEEKGLPYLAIETDYSQSGDEQIKTRLNAFTEML
ncbi:MAG: 2-hydroxyacyl-CoA dehydratase family protein [Firmicutes bacterium]|nr:2-hydroxyacyl-CoA dehydratase family protein [Bacillota bacterium]